uniref:Uncharacterized protein n=1 Tax=Arundo donax TaxID=35708 RepID=A0A0A9FEZ9_ARUDO
MHTMNSIVDRLGTLTQVYEPRCVIFKFVDRLSTLAQVYEPPVHLTLKNTNQIMKCQQYVKHVLF